MSYILRRSFFALFLTLTSTALFSQLSGTYTIGGTSPDYATITAAVSAIDNFGASAAVTFNIRQGTYTEQVSINQILGASATNTITFQGDPTNTQNPVIQHTSTGSASSLNFVWRFNGADYIRLKNLTLKATSSTYSKVITYQGASNRNIISYCTILGNKAASTSNNEYVISNESGSSNISSYNEVSNCIIDGGSYSFYLLGSAINSREDSNLVINNVIKNFGWKAVHAEYQSDIVIQNNSIESQKNPAYTSLTELHFNYCYGLNVVSNKIIHHSSNGRAINLSFCNATSNSSTKILNNFVSMLGSATQYGLYSYRCKNNEYYYNSFYIEGNSSSGIVFDASTSSSSVGQIYTKNNCVQMSAGYPVEYKSSTFYLTYTTELNYNNYYTPNSTKIKYYNNNYTSISSWKNATGKDVNTIQVNPYYYSKSNLHTNATGLNGKGTNISGFTKDIDGETRSSSPDIGADEFNTASLDAGISEFITEYCPGLDSAKVIVRNNGSTTITSLSIDWETKFDNGNYNSQTAVSWTGSMSTGQTKEITLGAFNFPKDSVTEIKAFCYNPNNSSDGIKNNDTLESGSFNTKMSGTYTVGGTNPSFNSITAALTEMQSSGICGPTILLVRQGTYTGQLNLGSIPGASATSRVTLKADSNNTAEAILNHSSYVVNVNGASYFTIDGFTIKGTGFSNRIYFSQTSTGIEFLNNKIEGLYTSSTSTSYACIRFTGRIQTDVVIKGNTITQGSYGIYASGVSNAISSGMKIENNTILNSHGTGVSLAEFDGLVFNNNTIQDTGRNSTVYSITLNRCDNITRISNNKIHNRSTSTAYGIYLDNCQNSSSIGLMYNNMISISKNSSVTQYGIYIKNSSSIISSYNSIRLASTSASSYGLFYYGGSSFRNYNNNIFCEAGYPLYTNSTSNITHSDYNNFNTNGNSVAYWNGGQTTLADLTANGGKNGNSISVNNGFLTTTNLRSNAIQINNKGIPSFGVSTDIDGKPRHSSTPDIGVNEVTFYANDANIDEVLSSVCAGSSPISVNLVNMGTSTLSSAKIHWAVKRNSGTFINQTPYTWTGNLASGQDALVSFGSYNFQEDSSYVVKAYTSLPNNLPDSVYENDTTTSTSFKTSISGTFTIGGTNPDYTSIVAAITALKNKGVCGPVTFNIRQGTYANQLKFDPINGTSIINRITFQSDPSNSQPVTLSRTSSTVEFNGGNYITLNGLELKSSSNNGTKIRYVNNSTGVIVENCNIYGHNYTSPSNVYTIESSNTSVLTNCEIKNCHIFNSTNCIDLNGSSTVQSSGTKIINNIMDNFLWTGISMDYHNESVIKGNYFKDRGAYFTGRTFHAIESYNSTIKELSNNTAIIVCRSNGYGFRIGSHNSSGKPALIANNKISIVASGGGRDGLYVGNSSNLRIIHNSILLGGLSASNSGIVVRTSPNTVLLNNNVKTNNSYAIYVQTNSDIDTSNYNNFYTTTGQYVAYWKTGVNNSPLDQKATLSALVTSSGKDANSISVDPGFTSDTNLTLASPIGGVNNKGIHVPYVQLDFEGDIRGTSTVDIGADENNVNANDAGIGSINQRYCAGPQTAKVKIKNYGTAVLRSSTIHYSIQANGGAWKTQSAVNWSGVLSFNQDTLVSLGMYTFSADSTYKMRVYTSGPNAVADSVSKNDTLYQTLTIDTLPIVSLSAITSVCSGSSDITLSGGTPVPGNYSGSFVNSGKFSPTSSGSGNYTINYSFTNNLGCFDTAKQTITIHALPAVSLNPPSICNDSVVVLAGGLPTGGTYSGNNVSSGNFNGLQSGAGNHEITYTVQDNNGCSGSDTAYIMVRALPTISFGPLADVCFGSTAFALSASPINGLFTGTGVSNGSFNPSSVSNGSYVLSYEFTDQFGCTNTDTASQRVLSAPIASLSNFNNICVNVDSVLLSNGSPANGIYSGPSVVNGVFYPSTAGVGTHAVKYKITLSGGCTDSVTKNIVVDSVPNVTLNLLPICSDSILTLSGGVPQGGVYSGAHVSNGVFNSSAAGAGNSLITYNYTNSKGCQGSFEDTLLVRARPAVSFGPLANLCQGAPAVNLSATPVGGTYTGVGISNGMFNTTSLNPGSYVLNYAFSDQYGCSNSDTAVQRVLSSPVVSLSNFNNRCVNENAFSLSNGSPVNGTYSGLGVLNGMFHPNVAGKGTHTLKYKVTLAGGCADSAIKNIIVDSIPNVTLNLLPICADSMLTLSGGIPVGGNYSGANVSNGVFNGIAAGAGNSNINYSYTDGNGCSNSDTSVQLVNPLPTVTMSNLFDRCDSSGSFTLTSGSPSGGVYSGNYISGGVFSTNAAPIGNHSVTYTRTNSFGCSNKDTAIQTILALPNVSFPALSAVCDSSPSITISGGLPTGGTYNGPFLNGQIFNPSLATVGSHLITYSYTGTNNCTDSAVRTIMVNALPLVSHSAVSNKCLNDTAILLTGGIPSTGTYSGPGVIGSSFNPMSAGLGSKTINYKVTDNNACTDSVSLMINVNPNPVVSILTINNLCENADSLSLIGSTPIGGTYSGGGVYGSKLYVNGLSGSQQLIYNVTNSFNCSASDTSTYSVLQAPVVNLTSLPVVCLDSSSLSLTGGSPLSGNYSGPGVNANSFYASVAGAGSHSIKYTVTNTNNCSDSAIQNLKVNALPTVSLALPDSICLNSSLKLSSGLPIGGIYSGGFVSNGVLTPNTPRWYKVTYDYIDTNKCRNMVTDSTKGQPWTNIAFTPISEVCIGSTDSINLNQATPLGGTYYGKNTNSINSKHSVAQVKTDTIWYKYTNGACIDSAYEIATVNPLPVVSIENDTLCKNTPSFTLISGLPAGGTYTGTNVSAGNYFPSIVSGNVDTVEYTYTDANNCANKSKATFLLHSPPSVSISSVDSSCNSDTAVTLIGVPNAAIFSGIGIVGQVGSQVFDASKAFIGSNRIALKYIDASTQCEDSTSKNIYVAEMPFFNLGNDTTICGDAQLLLNSNLIEPQYYFEWVSGEQTPDLTVSQGGKYWVTAYNSDLPRCFASDTIILDYEEVCTGIENNPELNSIAVYPNPAKDLVYIKGGAEIEDLTIKLYDANGREINSIGNTTQIERTIELNTSELENGAYYLRIQSEKQYKIVQLIISK